MQLAATGRSVTTTSSPATTSSKVCGTWGGAGNLPGEKIDGDNIVEAACSTELPNPPLTASHNTVLFEKPAPNLGYQSFPVPAANASHRYVNLDGGALADVMTDCNSDNPKFTKLGFGSGIGSGSNRLRRSAAS